MFTVFTVVQVGLDLEAYGFSAFYRPLSVGVGRTDNYLMVLIYIYYCVGNVSHCGDTPGRNPAFDGRYL